MNQPAKAQEPSMEEILASIRRIIADEDTGKAAKPPAPPPEPAKSEPPRPVPPVAVAPKPAPPPPAPPEPPAANNQSDIDAMLADIDAQPKLEPIAFEPPPEPVAPPAADVLDLTEAMAAPPPGAAASFRTIDASSDVIFTDPQSDAPPAPAYRPVDDTPRPSSGFDQGLISNATMSAVDSAFNSLAHTVLGNNARTLEDLVKEMLRPMLKGWLDDNLPGMVERIVRAEIERVSRGGR
jgi:hypothetical protein